MEKLKIASFNCKNVNNPSTLRFISDKLKTCNFLLIQEHWLYESQFHLFDNVFDNIDVCVHGKSAMDPSVFIQGRPYGGTAIIWKSNISNKIIPVTTISHRVTCIKVMIKDDLSMLLFNVYMPCDQGYKGDKFIEYQDILAEIHTIANSNDSSFCIIGGDFNTDFSRVTSPHTVELKSFCSSENLVPCASLPLSLVTYTYECSVTYTKTLIDHFLVSDNFKPAVLEYVTENTIDNCSDHKALILTLDMSCDSLKASHCQHSQKVAWYKASIIDIEAIKSKLDEELDKIVLPVECINCTDIKCTTHLADIERYHNDIVHACLSAATILPHTKPPRDDSGSKGRVFLELEFYSRK